jgi:hypothetical protein
MNGTPQSGNAGVIKPQPTLNPQRPIEGAVLNGFADVLGGDGVGLGEIGEGAGDFEDAVVGAGTPV